MHVVHIKKQSSGVVVDNGSCSWKGELQRTRHIQQVSCPRQQTPAFQTREKQGRIEKHTWPADDASSSRLLNPAVSLIAALPWKSPPRSRPPTRSDDRSSTRTLSGRKSSLTPCSGGVPWCHLRHGRARACFSHSPYRDARKGGMR
jgi:hypothetical protein